MTETGTTTTDDRDPIRNDREDVLRYILHSGLVISFTMSDTINGAVHRDYLMIHNAPARVVREVVNNFVMVDLTPRGLRIPLTPLDRTP